MNLPTKPLRAAMDSLRACVSTRTIPILSCVHIKAWCGTLSITATDIDKWETLRLPCDGFVSECCVSHRLLSSALSGGEEVSIVDDGDKLVVRCGGDKTTIPKAILSEWPAMPENKSIAMGVSCQDLSEGIAATSFASANKNLGRYELESVCVVSKPTMLSCLAYDGRSGALWSRSLACPEFEILIRDSEAKKVSDLLAMEGAVFGVTKSHAVITHNSGVFMCKLLEEKFPIKGAEHTFGIPRKDIGEISVEEFSNAVKSCQDVASDKFFRLALAFSDSGLVVDFEGDAVKKILVAGKFADFCVDVDVQYISKCLKGIKEATCKIFTPEGGRAIGFRAGDLDIILMALMKV